MNDSRMHWQADLIGRHPRLFGVSANPMSTRGYPTCGPGWHDLLHRCCVRIESVLTDGEEFAIDEIVSKYGALRFDWIGSLPPATVAKIDHAIELAEARSACSCEVCGAEGRLFSNRDWLTTVCFDHASGEPVAVSPGFENLHVTRALKSNVEIATCRRYIRETDSFVDVDPASLGVVED